MHTPLRWLGAALDRPWLHRASVGRGLLLAGLAVAVTVGLVLAATTFVPDSVTFTWLNPGYRLTVDVSAMTGPDNKVCLTYTATPPGTTTTFSCTCPGCTGGGKIGTWVCTIDDNIPSATVSYDFAGYSGVACAVRQTQGPSGSFNTGPNAVGLRHLGAAAGQPGGRAAAGLAAVGACLAGVMFLRRRS